MTGNFRTKGRIVGGILAKHYGVYATTIHDIRNGTTWRNLL